MRTRNPGSKRAERKPRRRRADRPLGDLVPESWVARSLAKRAALLVVAGVLAVLGVVFWLVPIVTGVPFWVAAVVALAMTSRRVCGWINAADRRLPPKARRGLRRCQDSLRRVGPWVRRRLGKRSADLDTLT